MSAVQRDVIPDLVEQLADRAHELCARFLKNGYLAEKRYWRCGNIEGDAGQSLVVWLTGPKAGQWCDFNGRRTGDMLNLIAVHACGGDVKRAIKWAQDFIGTDRSEPEVTERRRVARQVAAVDEEERNRGKALHLYLGAGERLAGTAADLYLRRRGIDLSALGRQPRALRFAARLWNGESQGYWPALVAAISGPDGVFAAVHRTWLWHDPARGIVKAPLDEPKMTLGRYAGGCIRLWRGASNKPLRDAPDDEWPVIAEGLEDGLTAVCADPMNRVLVAVSGANLGSMVLPPQIPGVVLLAQNDTEPDAIKALERAIAHFQRCGKRVRLARPPQYVKDVNELAQRELTHES